MLVVGRGLTPTISFSVSRGSISHPSGPGSSHPEGVASRTGGGTATWEALSGVESPSTEETPREAGGASIVEVQPRIGCTTSEFPGCSSREVEPQMIDGVLPDGSESCLTVTGRDNAAAKVWWPNTEIKDATLGEVEMTHASRMLYVRREDEPLPSFMSGEYGEGWLGLRL
ncbi:hypothetical protein Pcinc_008795 [Petrolisthes cinctipes]|uniref:Uncharacterized protein n=1 Tax=Petrolisthes cinctipes TaxID=88211 RepID=A0AAE1KWX9_PETCI|nr:hypothetical protein Pcinc_009104 [Petrolisthes cinctipes]KAK3887108.1 hypothetical protein Pcinc_008795 [Petrolisthes cinctipes]